MDVQSTITSNAATSASGKSLHCIVKLGGAAITYKNEFERINEENLCIISSQLREAMNLGLSYGMDWSRRPGSLEQPSVAECSNDQLESEAKNFVVVHGAVCNIILVQRLQKLKEIPENGKPVVRPYVPIGSFGHFQASKSGVHKGGLERPVVKSGFVATRISVTSLNLEVVRALAKEGIPSVGMSPFSCGWSTSERNIATADIASMVKVIDNGFTPVLHGDAVLDASQGCTILRGDVIISHLAEQLRPDYVVFLTDVFGVYTRPPTEPDAILLREIAVREDGSWYVLVPKLQDSTDQVQISVTAHDTTGGMVTKISEAAIIARLGIDVYIVKAATDHSLRALKGELKHGIPDDWLGTAIRLVK